MKKKRQYSITTTLLDVYQTAALRNAESLLGEAKLLYDGGRFARTYFLGVSSIEETGKAYLAYTGKQRNLADEGVQARLRASFEDHSQKVTVAFAGWLFNSQDREDYKVAIELMGHLKRGREASMYIDVGDDGSVSVPEDAVRQIAARDCIAVASNCFHHTRAHIASGPACSFSSFEDKFFKLNNSKLATMFNTPNFGDFLLDELKNSKKQPDLIRAAVTYHDKYYARDRLYETKG